MKNKLIQVYDITVDGNESNIVEIIKVPTNVPEKMLTDSILVLLFKSWYKEMFGRNLNNLNHFMRSNGYKPFSTREQAREWFCEHTCFNSKDLEVKRIKLA